VSSLDPVTVQRAIAWTKDDPVGAEFATVELSRERMRARGVAIGSSPQPYRLDYELETTARFLTRRAVVSAVGAGWTRRLELERREGGWSAEVSQSGDVALPEAGGDLDALGSALDPDLGLSPLFNSMPVLRHGLHEGGRADDFLMVWISVPDLGIHPSPQRYTYLETRSDGARIVRFEGLGEGEPFVADLSFDADGLVIDYPGIASRM
jgi:uncharacterized protein